MSDEPKLEEKAIAQAVEAGVSSQVKSVEEISVQIQTDLLQAVQGEVQSASIQGKGLVVQDGIRVEEIDLQTDRLAINPLNLLFGQIKLKQPLDSTARVVLTEADLNQAANADVFIKNLPDLTLDVEGRPVTLALKPPLTLHLPGENRFKVSGQVEICELDRQETLCFKAVMSPHPHEKLLLEEFSCESGKYVSLDLTIALLRWLNDQIKAPYLELAGMTCRITHLELQQGQLTMEAEAQIQQFPESP
jgi:LmeA-like phospholipid-binding